MNELWAELTYIYGDMLWLSLDLTSYARDGI
jgi:hypothetical protein